MKTTMLALRRLIIASALVSAQAWCAEPAAPGENSDEQYLFHPDESKQKNFDTDVEPLHESSLQGFNCMDRDGDGYLSNAELETRGECVDNAAKRGLETSKRTSMVLDLMDADRDRRVSKREFNIWNEMRAQQHELEGYQQEDPR